MNSLDIINKRYNNDLYLTFFIKKTEKIVSALYLITDYLKEKEPLKWEVRKKAVNLFSEVMKLNDDSFSDKFKIFSTISFQIFEILSFLELASATNLISEDNHEVLKREFDLLLSLIKNNSIKINNQLSPYLGGDYFKVKDKSLRPKEIEDVLNSVKDINEDKGQFKYKGHNVFDSKKTKTDKITNNEKKISRRDKIIEILSKGQKLTIKDISKTISDCSEKTIQRELQSMLKDKLLNKEGERRWSRYSLISE
ncbi:hypothetical protein KKH36_03325 [Patescibacteria group bacterium]|nr:hypothetical protein [Patescibacteria group bacterium]